MPEKQYIIFRKYKRAWLHEKTGYSLGHLSRMATRKEPLPRFFIERVCSRLNESEEELFRKEQKGR